MMMMRIRKMTMTEMRMMMTMTEVIVMTTMMKTDSMSVLTALLIKTHPQVLMMNTTKNMVLAEPHFTAIMTRLF